MTMGDDIREIHNPRTGQTHEVRRGASGAGCAFESVNPPGVEREPVHTHPRQTSGAEVTAGSLVFEVDGRERRLSARANRSMIPPGVPHRFWNDGDEDAASVQFFAPALDSAAFFETLFALAATDQLDAKGMPKPLQLALLVPEFGEEIRPVTPPWPVLRVLSALLSPIARARGYRARLSLP